MAIVRFLSRGYGAGDEGSMISFRFRGNPLLAPVPRGPECDRLRARIGEIIGRDPVVSSHSDYEDWTESASLLASFARSGLEMTVAWSDPETGEPGEAVLPGRPCAQAFPWVRFPADEIGTRCWPL